MDQKRFPAITEYCISFIFSRTPFSVNNFRLKHANDRVPADINIVCRPGNRLGVNIYRDSRSRFYFTFLFFTPRALFHSNSRSTRASNKNERAKGSNLWDIFYYLYIIYA